MSGRKNTQFRRNYLVKCPCPNCSKDSEHSFSRVQKGAQLVCPHCSTLFKTAQNSKMHLPDDEFASLKTISFGKATLKK